MSESEGASYAASQRLVFFETSAKTGDNVEALFTSFVSSRPLSLLSLSPLIFSPTNRLPFNNQCDLCRFQRSWRPSFLWLSLMLAKTARVAIADFVYIVISMGWCRYVCFFAPYSRNTIFQYLFNYSKDRVRCHFEEDPTFLLLCIEDGEIG